MFSRKNTGLVVAISLLGIIPSALAATKVFQPGIDPTTGKPIAEAPEQSRYPTIRRGQPADDDSTATGITNGPDARVASRPPREGRMTVFPASEAPAEQPANPAAKVVGGFQKFGRSVFGRILPGKGDHESATAAMRQANPHYRPPTGSEPRAGSILSRKPSEDDSADSPTKPATGQRKVAVVHPSRAARKAADEDPKSEKQTAPAAPQPSAAASKTDSAAAGKSVEKTTASTDQETSNPGAASTAKKEPSEEVLLTDDPDKKPEPAAEEKPAVAAAPARTPGEGKELDGLSHLVNPVNRSLHERLSMFRSSVFEGEPSPSDQTPTPAKRPAAEPEASIAAAGQPQEARSDAAMEVSPEPVARPAPGAPKYARDEQPTADLPATAMVEDPTRASPAPSEMETLVEPPVSRPPVVQTPAARSRTTSPATAPSEAAEGVLFARRGPAISVQTIGPRRISVGKESVYRVGVQNSGEEAAEEVVVSVNLPTTADVVGAQPSAGSTQTPPTQTGGRTLVWRIDHLGASAQEQLLLRIVPRESKPFDLGVRWDYRAAASQAMIEVQEPRLELGLDGPREVLFGKDELYRLKLANTGNGPAENVVLSLLPVGSGNQPVSQNMGTIAAGADKVIEVELTARQVGDLEIRVEARGDGGVHAELAERVLVRRAGLAIDVSGPERQYVDTVAAYTVCVSNPGTAPAQNIALAANLPAGAKYLSGIDGGRLEANGTKVAWTLPTLMVGEQREFTIRCTLGLPGDNRLEIVSSADDDLTASSDAVTRVEAIADLVLEVHDPDGPVAVGADATYELVVRNRGTKSAENVQVKAFFSHGIEPTRVEGGQHRIGPGQVIFNPVATVPAGGKISLTVHARAETSGNHIFRAEVHSQPQGTRLVSEETTHYYLDGPTTASQQNSAAPPIGEHGGTSSGRVPHNAASPMR